MAGLESQNQNREKEIPLRKIFQAISLEGSVYEPREDSMLMLDVLQAEPLQGKQLLDVGCGTGILSLYAATRGADVTASDVDLRAVENLRLAATSLGLKVRVVVSDAFNNIQGRFDIVVMNPPYLPSKEMVDLATDGGKCGTAVVRKFLNGLEAHLQPSGYALLLVSSATAIQEIVPNNGFDISIIGRKKLFFEELRAVRIRVNPKPEERKV